MQHRDRCALDLDQKLWSAIPETRSDRGVSLTSIARVATRRRLCPPLLTRLGRILTFSCKIVAAPESNGDAAQSPLPPSKGGRKRRKRLVVEGEIRAGPRSELHEEGELLVVAKAIFSKTAMRFLDEEVYAQAVERRWAEGPPPYFEYEDLTCLPWGAQAEELASKLSRTHRRFCFRDEMPEMIDEETGGMIGYGEGCTPFEMSDLPPP